MTSYCRRTPPVFRASQGDIYRDVVAPPSMPVGLGRSEEVELADIEYPYAIVLTQECDLEQDFSGRQQDVSKQDKCLPSILLSPAYLAERLREGDHLSELGLAMNRINSDRWRIMKGNNNKRYHFLERDIGYSVPDLVIDFKHYFTISRDFFYSQLASDEHYVASLDVLYREDLSHRFAHFLSRIGLPDHHDE